MSIAKIVWTAATGPTVSASIGKFAQKNGRGIWYRTSAPKAMSCSRAGTIETNDTIASRERFGRRMENAIARVRPAKTANAGRSSASAVIGNARESIPQTSQTSGAVTKTSAGGSGSGPRPLSEFVKNTTACTMTEVAMTGSQRASAAAVRRRGVASSPATRAATPSATVATTYASANIEAYQSAMTFNSPAGVSRFAAGIATSTIQPVSYTKAASPR